MPVGSTPRRQQVLLIGALVVLLLFAGKLVQVQIVDGPALAQEARESRTRTYPIHSTRGQIVDAEGVVLATSVMSYDIQVDQRQIPAYVRYDEDGRTPIGRGAAAAAAVLAPLLNRNAHELGAELTGSNGGLRIATQVTPEVRNAILDLGINGLTTSRVTTRTYPAGSTAGSLIGWVNAGGQGASGLEYRFEDQLTGTDGSRSGEIGVGGLMIPGVGQEVVPAQNGETVHLTIDADLQQYSQQVIDAVVDTRGADWGAVVVTEVGTGRLLAFAESDMVNPSNPTGFGQLNAIQSPYAPGSTAKILTVAAALEEGLVTPTTEFTVPYRLTTENGQTFKDHTEHPDQVLTTTGILAQSSNTGTIQIGSLMSPETRAAYMEAFGWGEPTGVELPGETPGLGLDPDKWDGRSRYVTMIGQEVAVNLLQNTNVIATLANGGVRTPIHLVDGFTDSAGRFVPVEAGESTQVVSAETAEQMMLMLESVTTADGATGGRAAIDGYRVAGKTGTAQIADGAGGLSDTAASFVGVVPAEDPKIAVGVIIYRPDTGFFGGTIAAPVFQDVASFALSQLGVPPSSLAPTLFDLGPGSGTE